MKSVRVIVNFRDTRDIVDERANDVEIDSGVLMITTTNDVETTVTAFPLDRIKKFIVIE